MTDLVRVAKILTGLVRAGFARARGPGRMGRLVLTWAHLFQAVVRLKIKEERNGPAGCRLHGFKDPPPPPRRCASLQKQNRVRLIDSLQTPVIPSDYWNGSHMTADMRVETRRSGLGKAVRFVFGGDGVQGRVDQPKIADEMLWRTTVAAIEIAATMGQRPKGGVIC